LGEGGFGKVVLGVHRATKQKVAIKIIKTQMIGNAQVME
jgi:serine/threonine protein kinase